MSNCDLIERKMDAIVVVNDVKRAGEYFHHVLSMLPMMFDGVVKGGFLINRRGQSRPGRSSHRSRQTDKLNSFFFFFF